MKSLTKFALLVAASVLSTSGVLAQSAAKANIPFAFTLEQETMPPGIYTVSLSSQRYIELWSLDKKIHVFGMVMPTDRVGGGESKLIFHRYGDQYFLSQVQGETGTHALKIPVSKQERQVQTLEARRRLNNTEVALK